MPGADRQPLSCGRAAGVPLSSLFQDASVKLEYILASLNFPNSWDTHRMLVTEARIFLTICLQTHVTSQPVSEEIWRKQQQLWRLEKCCGIGEIGLDYTHPVWQSAPDPATTSNSS